MLVLSACLLGIAGPLTAAARTTGTAAKAAAPITIGAAVNLTGFEQPYDQTALRGAMFAIQDINAKGGVLGHPLKLTIADGKSDAATGGTAATTVIDKGAQVLLVPCNITSAAAGVATKKGLVAMSLCSGAPEFGPAGIGPLAFSAGTAANLEGAVAAEFAYKRKGWRSVYFLELSSFSYTKDVTTYFKQRWTQLAGTVDFVQTCDAPPSIVTMERGMRSAGINLPLISCVAADGDYWLKGVPDLNNFYNTAYGSIYGDDSNKQIDALIKRYTQKYHAKPPNSYIVQGYSAVRRNPQGYVGALHQCPYFGRADDLHDETPYPKQPG
jgi:branched-chain amino acid transport system substrate-binding protein